VRYSKVRKKKARVWGGEKVFFAKRFRVSLVARGNKAF
jgi:hypothetical protein